MTLRRGWGLARRDGEAGAQDNGGQSEVQPAVGLVDVDHAKQRVAGGGEAEGRNGDVEGADRAPSPPR